MEDSDTLVSKKVKLVSHTPNIETTIVEIARVSSSREDKKAEPEKLLNYLIKNKHWSPFEHGYVTLEIRTSRAIGRQLLRHRSFTFQEFSQRYSKVLEFEPIELRKEHEKNRQSSTEVFNPNLGSFSTWDEVYADEVIQDYLEYVKIVYDKLLSAGVAKECARMILPEAATTTIYMTGSVRSWVHFLQVRDDEHAQKEIQQIAKSVKEILSKLLPIVFKS